MSAAEYKAFSAAYPPVKKKPKRQQESLDQKAYVKALNAMGIGFFYRVKTMGTFDPVRGFFRKNNELVGISDICGYLDGGTAVFIEVKRVIGIEKRKKLIFKVKTSAEQNEFLLKAHRMGCLAGVAFNIYDCISIAADDPKRYPRHPRTYAFLPKEELEWYAEDYKMSVQINAELKKDVVYKEVTLALPDKD